MKNASTLESTRIAFGQFATGVCIVTATNSGVSIGMTVSSFNSVSLDPPLVLWSVGRHAPEYTAFCQASHYAIHVLANDQVALSNRFATPGIDKFEGIEVAISEQGVPLLSGTVACFHCAAMHNYPAGDHNILVGSVLLVDQAASGVAPLLYYSSGYHDIGAQVNS